MMSIKLPIGVRQMRLPAAAAERTPWTLPTRLPESYNTPSETPSAHFKTFQWGKRRKCKDNEAWCGFFKSTVNKETNVCHLNGQINPPCIAKIHCRVNMYKNRVDS